MHVSFSALIPGLFKSARVSRIEFAKPCVHRSGHSAVSLQTQPFGKCGIGRIRQGNGRLVNSPSFLIKFHFHYFNFSFCNFAKLHGIEPSKKQWKFTYSSYHMNIDLYAERRPPATALGFPVCLRLNRQRTAATSNSKAIEFTRCDLKSLTRHIQFPLVGPIKRVVTGAFPTR